MDYWAIKLLGETEEILYGFPQTEVEREFRGLLAGGQISYWTATSEAALQVAERLRREAHARPLRP